MRILRFWCIAAALASLVWLANCGGGGDCQDGADNDGDGLIDGDDPACAAGGDAESPDPVIPQCDDGIDNDDDGAIDTMDPGCDSAEDNDEFNEPIAACNDGIDNDSDGKTDFPNDPGCDVTQDDDEDGKTDYPDDPGCDNAHDDDELNSVSTECGMAIVQSLPASGVVTGNIGTGQSSLVSQGCNGTGVERVFQLHLDEARAIQISTNFPETTLDTVVYIRSACTDSGTELGCNDDVGNELTSTLLLDSVPAGDYFVVVDGSSAGATGDFKLEVLQFVAAGAPCNPATDTCLEGRICQLATPAATGETCELPRCSDGIDNDADGAIDFPLEPGCDSLTDNDEADDCFPTIGPNCPQCSNGIEDDGDGLTDYPDDPGCTSASSDSEVDCLDTGALVTITGPVTTGTTVGSGDDYQGGCGFANGAPEVVHRLVVPGTLTSLSMDTNGTSFDTVMYIKQEMCDAAVLECDDDDGNSVQSLISRTNVAAGTYFIFVDGYSANEGDYILNVSGTIATGQPCNQDQITSGLFTCQGGGACNVTCQ
jgi:hypothetical protein